MPAPPPPPPTLPPAAGWMPAQLLVLDSPGAFGAAVQTAREAQGLGRQTLARRAGVGRRFLYDLEHGKPTLRFDKIFAVLAALGLAAVVADPSR